MVVAELSMRYLRGARYDDEVRVRCWVREVASRKVVFGYALDRLSDGELLATAVTTMFVLDAGMRPPGCRTMLPPGSSHPPTRSGSPDARTCRPDPPDAPYRASCAGAGQCQCRGAAPVLAAEDARQWNDAVLRRGVTFADTVVRSRTALAIGRIGDLQGLPLLLPLLEDPEDNVRPSAAFAMGLLRDTNAVAPLIRALSVSGADINTAREIITALARIGGRDAAEFFSDAHERTRAPHHAGHHGRRCSSSCSRAWRLGPRRRCPSSVRFLADTNSNTRWRAIYAVSRLRRAAGGAAGPVSAALVDKLPLARAMAARALNRTWADSGRPRPQCGGGLLARALTDDDARRANQCPRVRSAPSSCRSTRSRWCAS